MSNVWFSSDPHYYHNNVIRYCNRPFQTVEEMNEKLILNWNSLVEEGDTAYLLGDFSLAMRPVELFTKRLNGTKILVSGNHDWTHPSNKKSNSAEKAANVRKAYYDHGWASVHTSLSLNIAGREVVMCHMPYSGGGDSGEYERFAKYRLPDEGKILLHGHTHSHEKVSRSPKGTLQIHVGVDAWDMKPIKLSQIEELIITHGN